MNNINHSWPWGGGTEEAEFSTAIREGTQGVNIESLKAKFKYKLFFAIRLVSFFFNHQN